MSQPLTQQDFASLLSCLQNALNQNPEVQKQAEAYIQSLDSRAGFSSALAEIVGNREADHSARYLASVHLKNSIHRNWKKRVGTSTGISPEEKAHLRSRLSGLIPQDDNQIAVQVALVYAKVARFDYPADWPGLFADLLANVNGGSALTVRRVYLILHHVLKELSSKRLVTELLFGHVWGCWCADTQALLAGLPAGLEAGPAAGSAQAQALLQSCERWMLLLKILRRLILHGFPSDAKSLSPVPAVHSCCPHMVSALQGLLGVRPRGKPLPRSHLQAMLERAILKLLKTLCQVLEAHPCKSYKGQAGGSLEPGSGQPRDTTRYKAMAAEDSLALAAEQLYLVLLQELSDAGAANRPLRRRIGLVVAANVDRVKEDDPIRPSLYGSMLQLLSEPDPAVCLSGLGALTALLGDFNFLEEPFAPLLPACLQLLLQVMGGSAELDTQKQAFGLLNLVIERCGEALRPHVGALAGALPALWEAAAGQSLLRIQILEAVQRLLNLSGPASPQLLPGLVLPLLSYSLDLRQPEPDLTRAWHMRTPASCATGQGADGGANGGIAPLEGQPPPLVLRLLPGPGPAQVLEALLSPFPALAAIAESSTEQLPVVMSILTSAALLAGPALWAAAGGHVINVFMAVVAPAEVVLWRLLELWAEAFDGLGQAGARRLCGLALCRGLALPSRGVLGLLDVLLPPITAVWFETEGGGGEDGGGVWRGEALPPSYDYFSAGMRGGGDEGLDEVVGPALDSEEAEGETARRALLRDADPAAAVTLGNVTAFDPNGELAKLSALMSEMESLGAAPILNDGQVCALSLRNVFLVLFNTYSMSGKPPGHRLDPARDFVLVQSFDRAACPGAAEAYGWALAPTVVLHGHALAEGEGLAYAAEELGLPISQRATLFSTPEDLAELESVFRSHPYPQHTCYIRRGHVGIAGCGSPSSLHIAASSSWRTVWRRRGATSRAS
eukprot:XP_001701665.1 predicted protein [Chlamydomonas reinhardtii]